MIIGPAFPLRGGIAQLNESLSAEFTKQGIENAIFSFYMQYPSFLFPGKTQTEEGDVKGPDGIKVQSTISSINPFSWRQTAKEIAKSNPDFVVVRYWLPFMGPCLGTICRWVKKATGAPVIAICDNVIPHEKRIGDRLFTQYFVNQIDKFIAMSASVLDDLKKFDAQKPRKLLYHPVYDHFGEKVEKSVARKRLGISDKSKVILFFGIIRKYKGLKLLLEALSQLESKEGIKLIVAGEFYESQDQYSQLVESLGIVDIVRVDAGFVDKDMVRYYFSAADLVAQPYLSATQSGVTQIAYHFETPMLVTNVGGLPEMVPNGKVGYVTERNSQEIAEALDCYFSGNNQDEFRKNILEEKKRFSWDFFAKEIAGLADSR